MRKFILLFIVLVGACGKKSPPASTSTVGAPADFSGLGDLGKSESSDLKVSAPSSDLQAEMSDLGEWSDLAPSPDLMILKYAPGAPLPKSFQFNGYWKPNAVDGAANNPDNYGIVTFGQMLAEQGKKYILLCLPAFW